MVRPRRRARRRNPGDDLLNESWRHLKRLHPSCDSERLRSFFAAARPFMVGGKACGAAGGGCILFLAREGERQALADACQTLDGALMPFRVYMDGVVIEWTGSSGSPLWCPPS